MKIGKRTLTNIHIDCFSGLITAVGILNLQMVDLRIPRNLFIAGFSLFLGLSLPQWLEKNSDAIDTGRCIHTIHVFISSPLVVNGDSHT